MTEMPNIGLFNLITDYTRVPKHSETILDHLWTSASEVDNTFIYKCSISDHFAIGCTLDVLKK